MLTCFLSGSVGERRGGVTTVAEVILGLTPFTHTHRYKHIYDHGYQHTPLGYILSKSSSVSSHSTLNLHF